MSSMKIFDIAGSALSAQSQRLNLVASNMANADSVSSSVNETYRSRQPVFKAMIDQMNPKESAVGVRTLGVVESQVPLQQEYAPEHPMANEEGYIYRPNVNVVEEMANMISASRSYQNNVEVVNSAKQMMMGLLRLGQ